MGTGSKAKVVQGIKTANSEMKKFLIVIEKTETNYSAYAPDLPGCIATGNTVEETEKNMYEAIEFHLEGLKEDNLPIPESSSIAEYVVMQ